MKKTLNVILAGMMLPIAAPQAQIQEIKPIVGTSGSSVVFGQSGDINLNQSISDNAAALETVMKQHSDIQKLDLEYLKSITERFNAQLRELNTLSIQLTKLSQTSMTSNLVKLEDYLNLVNEITKADETLKIDLDTYTLVSRESLPSYNSIEALGQRSSIATAGNIDMKPLTSKVDGRRVAILERLNNLQFPNMITRIGHPVAVTANALNPNLKGVRVLSEDEIVALNNEIQEKFTLTKNTRQLGTNYVNVIRVNILNFIRDYGVDESMRFRNDNDATARAAAFTRLAEGFMRRSYLRKKYGIPLGAIQTVDFEKRFANIEDFMYQPLLHALKSLREEAATNETDVLRAYENIRNFVELYDKKLTPVFVSSKEIKASPEKALEYASQNTGVIVRANSAITTITGQRAAAEAMMMMLRLILADTTEELMIYSSDIKAMGNYHDAKYKGTDAARASYNSIVCSIDYTLGEKAVAQFCGGKKAKKPAIMSGRSFEELFAGMMDQMENVEKARRQDGQRKQDLVTAAIMAGQTAAESAEQDDADSSIFE